MLFIANQPTFSQSRKSVTMENMLCKYSFHNTLLNIYFVLITHKNPRHVALLTVLLINSTFWLQLKKHSEEYYLQYVHVLPFWFMLRWLLIQPRLISTPQIMNGKYFQRTISMHSEDWEINTEVVFEDFSYLGTGRFIIRGKKGSLLFISWALSSGYLNKYRNKE